MQLRGDTYDALVADLEAAIGELVAAAGTDPASWTRGRPGHWTVGQHAAHVDIILRRTADEFDAVERSLRAGTLVPAPARRGPLQALFVWMVAGRGIMPRGAKTARWAMAPGDPARPAVLAALREGVARYRDLGARLDPAGRDRLWIANPFRPQWHYRLPEMVRVQAVHARHHARQMAELTGA